MKPLMTQKIKSQSGAALIEMMIAFSLFDVIIALSIESFHQVQHSLKDQDLMGRRIRLFHSLIHILGMPASVRAAVENEGDGSVLWKCVRGFECNPDVIRDITLFLPPLYNDGNAVTISGAVSGPPDNPLLYSMEGQPCNPSIQSCDPNEFPIAVSTRYQAICPPKCDIHAKGFVWSGPVYPAGLVPISGENCLRAHYLRIFYKFAPSPGASTAQHFQTVTGSIMVNSVSVNLSR